MIRILGISPGLGYEPETWARVLDGGLDGLLIRERDLSARALLDVVQRVQDLHPDLELWVHGRLDVALATGAGLHAPEVHPEVPPGTVRLSRPLHSPEQLPQRLHTHQILVSPVFPVPGKGPCWGVEAFHRLLDGLSQDAPRMYALGGVLPNTAAALCHPRLHGLAVMRSLWTAPDPKGLVARLREIFAADPPRSR